MRRAMLRKGRELTRRRVTVGCALKCVVLAENMAPEHMLGQKILCIGRSGESARLPRLDRRGLSQT